MRQRKSDTMPSLDVTHKMMMRRMGRLPLRIKIFFGLSMVLSILMYGSVIHTYLRNDLTKKSFLEVSTCPACYGQSFCDTLDSGAVYLKGYSKLRFLDYVNVKNVHFGTYGEKQVVLKKLAHDGELQEFDEKLCRDAGYPADCDVSFAISKIHDKSGDKWIKDTVTGSSLMMTCPTDRMIEYSIFHFREKMDAVDISGRERLYLVTGLMVNPEPIILQNFPREKGFPFPHYYGACGRFIVEGYVGETLLNYYHADWQDRVKYGYQVFKIADKFTAGSSGFALYWTDVGYDNLAVDADGNVAVIDAESIIVVDRWRIEHDKKPGWDEPHYSQFDVCKKELGPCLGFRTEELCTRHVVDHNYYAACRNLLSSYADDVDMPGGLLHDLPSHIDEQYHITDLLNECAKPSAPGGRLEIKDKILNTLEAISKLKDE